MHWIFFYWAIVDTTSEENLVRGLVEQDLVWKQKGEAIWGRTVHSRLFLCSFLPFFANFGV